MKHRLYKQVVTFIAIGFLGTLFAQKFDKKFTESFKTNKDVEVAINASNTDINVTTWNKNEVKIDAYIEIEGITKEEAEKYFKNWNFEALGNKKKVQITSKGNNEFNFKNDFVFFDDMNFDFKMPDIDFSKMETIVIPDLNFDLNFDVDFEFDDIFEDLEENMGKDGKYEFRWKDENHDIEINSKEEWEAFKKTKEYKELKKKLTLDQEKMRKELKESKEKMKIELKRAQEQIKKIDKEEIRKQLEKAKKELKKLKLDLKFDSNSDDIIINGKKINIKKRLEIKVPKGATFDLNTRHCKVKLPNTVAFGNVKYGTFDTNNLIGGKLKIDYSKVNINDLNACNLFLNNVTDAKIASVTNSNLSNNSSGVHILKINENVVLSDKFGELTIDSFNPNFGEFILNLSQSDATILLGNIPSNFKYEVNRVKLDNKRNTKLSSNTSTRNLIKINGDYSTIVIK
ncbi:hypothetical protein [Polaribacter sp.]|uniref:hypothetical protein n=1 Tax=Polaribacter sp. TaxID=1920175 RepID=UPI003F6D12C8